MGCSFAHELLILLMSCLELLPQFELLRVARLLMGCSFAHFTHDFLGVTHSI